MYLSLPRASWPRFRAAVWSYLYRVSGGSGDETRRLDGRNVRHRRVVFDTARIDALLFLHVGGRVELPTSECGEAELAAR